MHPKAREAVVGFVVLASIAACEGSSRAPARSGANNTNVAPVAANDALSVEPILFTDGFNRANGGSVGNGWSGRRRN